MADPGFTGPIVIVGAGLAGGKAAVQVDLYSMPAMSASWARSTSGIGRKCELRALVRRCSAFLESHGLIAGV
jgi:hypothetical protein